MATMNVSLPDEMKDLIEEQVRSGVYSNTSDYVRDVVRRDLERRQKLAEFRRLVQEGIDSGISPLSMEQIRLEARRRAGMKD